MGPGYLQCQCAECGAGRAQGRDRRRQARRRRRVPGHDAAQPCREWRRIAISVYDAKTLEGYQIRGAAEHVSDGPVVAMFKAMVEQMFQGTATAKGALVITPETVIVTTPGAENKKVL